jgi:hypothetical protein
MLIGVEKRFIFIANTKAASTSIEHVLVNHAEIERASNPQRKHIHMLDVLKEYAFLFNLPGYEPATFFRFGVMRDPIDWIGSWFRYRHSNKVAAPLPKEMDFAAFWAAKDWNIRRANGAPHLQRDFFTDNSGNLLVDVIIPYRDLDALFSRICAGLWVDKPLPQMNASNEKAETLSIPSGLRDELREYYAEDYKLLSQLPEINFTGLGKLDLGRANAG